MRISLVRRYNLSVCRIAVSKRASAVTGPRVLKWISVELMRLATVSHVARVPVAIWIKVRVTITVTIASTSMASVAFVVVIPVAVVIIWTVTLAPIPLGY